MQRATIILPILLLPITVGLWDAMPLQADDGPCKSLIVVYCTTCHNNQRMCDGLAEKDESAWKATIKEMGEYGDIDQATQDQVLTCLTNMKKGDQVVCSK